MHTSTIGIGLNVNETAFPEYLPNPVSMASITGRKYDTKTLLEEFLGCFDEKLDLAFSENGSARLMNDYTSRMYRRNTFAAYRDKADGGIFEGIIDGVEEYQMYKYCVRGRNGTEVEKADPYAFFDETR